MNIFELILSTLISTGLITAFLSHLYDKKLRTHEIKIQKYIKLIEELAKFTGNEPDWGQLRIFLNEALLFASDEVVGEILEFNKKFTEQSKTAENGNFQMTAGDLQPLVVAIRKDLYLKSKSIDEKGLTFFQKP
ncbi:MAG: hypothetical protein Q7R73_02100 [bacterium]|nr:hypothetical protein [bacterium]